MSDLISRRKAIEAIKTAGDGEYLGEAVKWATGVLNEVPSAGWIPCNERLPDKSGEYLITIKWEDRLGIYFSWFYLRDICWSYRNANVVAWMELPEPYEVEE